MRFSLYPVIQQLLIVFIHIQLRLIHVIWNKWVGTTIIAHVGRKKVHILVLLLSLIVYDMARYVMCVLTGRASVAYPRLALFPVVPRAAPDSLLTRTNINTTGPPRLDADTPSRVSQSSGRRDHDVYSLISVAIFFDEDALYEILCA
jgi:hypothetical protein